MSAKLEDLELETRQRCQGHLAECARRGILLRVTHTLRTYAEQDALYAQGRTTPGPRVTAAPAGYSWHNFGRAYDVCQDSGEPYPENDAWWEIVGEIGETVNLEWGGRWKHPDRPHFQHPGGLSLALARKQRAAESA